MQLLHYHYHHQQLLISKKVSNHHLHLHLQLLQLLHQVLDIPLLLPVSYALHENSERKWYAARHVIDAFIPKATLPIIINFTSISSSSTFFLAFTHFSYPIRILGIVYIYIIPAFLSLSFQSYMNCLIWCEQRNKSLISWLAKLWSVCVGWLPLQERFSMKWAWDHVQLAFWCLSYTLYVS